MLAASVMQRLLGLSGQQPPAAGPTDLNELVREMAELLRRSLGRGVSIRTHLAEDVGATVVDSGGLETSILNLAVNARDAMGACGELTIESALGRGTTVRVTFPQARVATAPRPAETAGL